MTTLSDAEVSARLDRLLAGFAGSTPPVRVVPKRDDSLQRAVHWALRVITLGGQDRYLSEYVTTLGRTIYVPEGWDTLTPRARYLILRHESVHLRQFERWGWVGMVLLYGLLPLPLGLAYGRARLEWEAYAETLRATAEVDGIAAARAQALREEIVARFTGPDYAWMWPFPGQVRRWVDACLDDLSGQPDRAAREGGLAP